MDGLKLDIWQKSFNKEVKSLKTEYDAFLLPKKFDDTYKVKIYEATKTLSICIETENIPK